MPKLKNLITAQELADALNLTVETIWRYTREKKIPFIEMGGRQYRYIYSDVLAALSGASRWEQVGSQDNYTYADYLNLPQKPGHRFEVLEGELVNNPTPSVQHQRVTRRLQRQLEDYFCQADSQGEVFDAPLDVTLAENTVVQPDLFYISGKQKDIIKETRIDGAPTLVVEVLSPATSRKDRMQKLQLYQDAGVKHCWLVSPTDKTLECYSLKNELYHLVVAGMEGETVEHPQYEGLSIDLTALWI